MIKFHRPKSIKIKTFLYIMSVVSTILLLMYVVQILGLQHIYEFTRQNEAKNVQKEMIANLENNDLPDAIPNIMALSRTHDIYVEIYDHEKDLVFSPFIYMEERLSKSSFRYPFNSLASRTKMTVFIDELQKTPYSAMVFKIKDREANEVSSIVLVNSFVKDGNEFFLITSSALEPVAATTSLLKKIFIIVLIIVLIIATIISLILSISFTKPLRKLSNAAKAVTAGDYSVRIDNKFNDEIGQLINDFNDMTTQLSKTDGLRKDLIANVSHELRTPLTMIKGYAETIRDLTGDNPQKREKQLEIIINESDRLSNLINNTLDLSALQAGKIKFSISEFNLSNTITELLKRYDIFKDLGYVFNTSVQEDVFITGDKERLAQVICNLLDNAVNHSIDNKQIFIKLYQNDGPILEITNFGDVIEKENLPHIWERYYKIDKVGNRRVTGTGIGLSIVKEILVAHNFDFGVSSSYENGTTFRVKFTENPIIK